jgi:voltage-gated potassium channel
MSSAPSSWRERLYIIIFEADTPAGKTFDIFLLIAILLSVLAVMLESVSSFATYFEKEIWGIEWFFTIIFTLEYLLRLLSSPRPLRYALSFFGIVDLLSILPSYLGLFVSGTHYLVVIRSLRLLRVFRILKLSRYLGEAQILGMAVRHSMEKITVFLGVVVTAVLIIGTTMHLIEGPENGFTNIPTSVYWAVVTLTTVGYGDIAPQTPLGKGLATLVMVLGYGVIAVPTGIVTHEIGQAQKEKKSQKYCPQCDLKKHDEDALHCKHCGHTLRYPQHEKNIT